MVSEIVKLDRTQVMGGAIIRVRGEIDAVTHNILSLSAQVIGYYADPVEDRYCELCGDPLVDGGALCASCAVAIELED